MLKVIGGVPDGEYKAIASGTLPSGKPVIVNSNGTVSVVEETAVSGGLGSPVVFDTENAFYIESVYDSANQKTVVCYTRSGGDSGGVASVATVSGTSVSFGTGVKFSENITAAYWTAACYDSANEKVVVFYQDANTNFGYATVGTVSGTSISFGSSVTFITNLNGSSHMSATYDEASGKVVIFYKSGSSGTYGRCKVGTVSGTTISFGSEIVFNSGNTDYIASTYDSNAQKIVIVYRDQSNSNYGTGVVGTVSGSSISFGTEEVFSFTNNDPIEIGYHAGEGRVVVVYKNGGNNNYGTALTGLVSGTSIAFGSPVVFNSATTGSFAVDYDSAAVKMVITYRDQGNSNYGTYVTATVSGENITFSSETVFESAYTDHTWVTFDASSNSNLISYRDSGNTDNGTGIVLQNSYSSTNLTAENYIGMSKGVALQTGSEGSTGSTNTFNSRTTSEIYGAYDANSNRVVIAYRDNGNGDNGTAIVGSISGTTITFGSPEIYHANLAQDNTVVFDSANNKVVISFIAWDNSNNRNGTSVVGTVSGTSISFGTPVQFNTIQTTEIASCFDSNSNKVVVVYRDISNSNYGTARVGTVSGTSISFGTEVVYESASTADNSIVFDSNSNKVVVAYYDGGNGTNGTAVVGTVSGTSISFGTPVVWDGGVSARHITTSFDTNSNKVVIAYVESSGNDIPKAIVGTVSGTSISFGTPTAYSTVAGDRQSMVYDVSANRHVIFFSDEGDSFKGKTVSGLVSGTSISFTEKALVADGSTQHLSAVYDPDDGKVILSFDNVSNNYGVSAVHTADTIATTRGEVADGSPARVGVIGVESTNQIGLTAGEKYYVQTDGTLSTTAGSPSVLAGTAISATKLVVKT